MCACVDAIPVNAHTSHACVDAMCVHSQVALLKGPWQCVTMHCVWMGVCMHGCVYGWECVWMGVCMDGCVYAWEILTHARHRNGYACRPAAWCVMSVS